MVLLISSNMLSWKIEFDYWVKASVLGVGEGAPLRVGEGFSLGVGEVIRPRLVGGFNLGLGAGIAQRMARALVWVQVKVCF